MTTFVAFTSSFHHSSYFACLPSRNFLFCFLFSGAAVSSDASVARAFHILKAAAAKWIHDVTTRNDAISDSILTALYR